MKVTYNNHTKTIEFYGIPTVDQVHKALQHYQSIPGFIEGSDQVKLITKQEKNCA